MLALAHGAAGKGIALTAVCDFGHSRCCKPRTQLLQER